MIKLKVTIIRIIKSKGYSCYGITLNIILSVKNDKLFKEIIKEFLPLKNFKIIKSPERL